MKHFYQIFSLLLISVLASCSSNDEPLAVDFKLSSDNPEIEITNKGRNASLNVIGYKSNYTLNLTGDFVNVIFDANVDWLSASYSMGVITIHENAIDNSINGDTRTGKINFTVFNNDKSASGFISVTQRVITYEDLLSEENKAIDFYLSKYTIVENLPQNNAYVCGEDAPYYKIASSPNVYMQVLSIGDGAIPQNGDRVYIRFMCYNLLEYFKAGEFNPAYWSGNYNDISGSPSYFIIGSDSQAT